ncbi:HEAT repeat domain-containing protein [Archangium primigenium]|uniref:HEAT repeat domain-containing protein n=1 Tax=[Archangium] primigenium TaxID=2792470 RepID=UPI0019575C4A|nr:HEAT repeat domain-containing protein [Archangium primigenium]MBM7119145.1 HEAT repeat domain-containing protein [Archangium primigenium]
MPRPSPLSSLTLALALLAPAAAWTAPPAAEAPALERQTCSLDGLLTQIRQGMGSKSEAYKRYLGKLLRESAVTLPLPELLAAFEREYDPAMVEHLAAALVARTERGLEDEAMQSVVRRALGDRDPTLRAASVRAMRQTGALERTGDMYERLMRDPSPEVRQEAATNLVTDNLEVYGGRHGPAADAAVAAAAASNDPAATARILGKLMTGEVSADSARTLERMLGSDSAEVRASASTALGGVPATEMASARQSLSAQYRAESNPQARKAMIESIARLGFSSAIPELKRLRDVDPRMAPEIDAWTRVLEMNLQEWPLIQAARKRQNP